jgi:hypothetical protein
MEVLQTKKSKIIELMTYNKKKPIEDYEEFKEIVKMVVDAKNEDAELFIKLLKFHRMIEKGNGIKNIYYIGMMVLRYENPEIYEEMLKWSYGYGKDILRLCRMNNMIRNKKKYTKSKIMMNKPKQYRSQINNKNKNNKRLVVYNREERKENKDGDIERYEYEMGIEEEIYARLIYENLKKMVKGEEKDLNMMLFKYLSYESGHFGIETEIIYRRVEDLINSDKEMKKLIFI